MENFNYTFMIVIVLGFIVCDILTGFSVAVATKKFTSSKMRQGLFHKLAELFSIFLAAWIQIAQYQFRLDFDIPFLFSTLAYITIMEIGSNIENIKKLNPEMDELYKRREKDAKKRN